MANVVEPTRDNWRALAESFGAARQDWEGLTLDHFVAQFWSQFSGEIADYLRALETITVEIDHAMSELSDL